MVSVCLPSYALLQHLPSYLGFSYLRHGVSLYGYSSKGQQLLLTLDEGYLLALSNSMKLSHAHGATQDGRVMVERSDRAGGPLEKGMANHFSILALRTP